MRKGKRSQTKCREKKKQQVPKDKNKQNPGFSKIYSLEKMDESTFTTLINTLYGDLGLPW